MSEKRNSKTKEKFGYIRFLCYTNTAGITCPHYNELSIKRKIDDFNILNVNYSVF